MMSIRVSSRVEQIKNLLEVYGKDGNGEPVGVDGESQHGLRWPDDQF